MALFAFIDYLIYDLIIKLADKDFSNKKVEKFSYSDIVLTKVQEGIIGLIEDRPSITQE